MSQSAIKLLETAKDLSVLFVGDRITDEYQYGTPLGRSPKEHLIPLQYQRKEIFDGGVIAAAAHAKSFCKTVRTYSRGPVTRKVRFVALPYMRKVGEMQYEDGYKDDAWSDAETDAIIVTDFGHGAVTQFDIDRLCASELFLAVNAQTNAANFGFNLVTKYPKADFIVIDEPEARLAARNRHGSIESVILTIARERCPKMIVTLGSEGAIGWEEGIGFRHARALTDKVVDTMGAGDAFFAVTSLFARDGSLEDLLAIGNAAGAVKTQILGHRQPVTKEAVMAKLLMQ